MSPNLFKTDAPAPASSDAVDPRPTGAGAAEKSRRRDRSEPASISVLGSGLTVDGEIKTRGDVQIEGTVTGNLTSEGQVSVSPRGVIDGDVTAERVIVAGRVEGTIRAREGARLVDGARVDADITSPRLELEDGAVLNGRVDMAAQAEPVAARPSKPDASEKTEERKQGAA